jgi:type I restriction enzyme S subunit
LGPLFQEAPLGEQKAIAHILGTLDDKIELNRKTSETLEAMARALFKSWFVDFDPVRAKAEGRPTGLPAEISDLFPGNWQGNSETTSASIGNTRRTFAPNCGL